MIKCEICEQELVSLKALSQHIRFHNITSKVYYDQYLRTNSQEGICLTCGKETKFKSLSSGYQKFCNLKCSNNNKIVKTTIQSKAKNRWLNYTEDDKQKISDKISLTVKEKWFDPDSFYNTKEYRSKLSKAQTELAKEKRENLIQSIPKITDFVVEGEYQNACLPCLFRCQKCNFIFETIWNYLQQGKQCPNCGSHSGVSKPEKELVDFIKSFGFKVVENSKKIIAPQEVDIFIPELKIGFEYNGLYWHSEQNIKDQNYHLKKLENCLQKGIILIQIFEDEWLFKQDIVKSRITQILNVNSNTTIYARNCNIKQIDSSEKNDFLNLYHLQGSDSASIKLGAFYNGILVSVMTFSCGNISKGSSKQDDVWELSRFCSRTDYRVIGIASKLLTYFKRNFSWKRIYSYADRRWSVGNLYTKIGFNLTHITKPNYWYLKNYRRLHRFNLRKKHNESPGIPEWVLRQNEGYHRIWDCGSLRFDLTCKED